jgi:hypothetical protein
VVTLHDCGGKLVAYGLSASAYSVKSHPKRPHDSEDIGHTGKKRRRIVTTSIARRYAPLSSAGGSSDPQQSGDPANTGVLPVVEPTVDRPGGVLRPMIDPHLQPLPHEPCPLLRLNHNEAHQLVPTLDEVLPPSCSWRGGIFITLFVSNLPQNGIIYARFGYIVVRTVRVQRNSSRVTHRSNSGSEDPPCVGMQGPCGVGPM